MQRITRRSWLTGTAALAPVLGYAVDHPPKKVARFTTLSARELIRRRHFPDLPLVTHMGKRVLFYDDLVKNRVVILNFMYAQCDNICPPVTANLVRVQERLRARIGRNIFMYSITLKPEQDSPAMLAAYAKDHGIGPGWLLLTGRPADIARLRRTLGFTYSDPVEDADASNHIGNIRYGNEPAVRWAAVPGQAPADWIAAAVLSEADGPARALGSRAG